MIPITAYTEPIPADFSSSEPPKIHEKDEHEESSSFAELLAGLMQSDQSENNLQVDEALDALAAEKSRDGSKLNFFANAAESGVDFDSIAQDILPDDFLRENNSLSGNFDFKADIDFSNIDNEFQNILSAEHLLNASLDADVSADDGALLHKIVNIKNTDASSELQDDISSSSKNSEVSDAELFNAANAVKEADSGKKARNANEAQSPVSQADVKNENTESLSKNKAGEENAANFSKREESVSKLDEMRNRIRKERVSLEVRDLRAGQGVPSNADKGYALVETAAGRTFANSTASEITLDLRLPDSGQSAQAQTAWEAKAGSALENMLARELHQNFNGDIVRHASIALRDGGAGTIKIALHPETLGNVKIHLELTDNKITGQIVVESQEALNAFRKEIAALEQAFRDSGFAEASLDLSFTAEGSGKDSQEFEDNSFLRQMAAGNYEGSYEQDSMSVIDVFFGRRTGSINMLA